MFFKSLLAGLLVGCIIIVSLFTASVWYNRYSPVQTVQNPAFITELENTVELTVIYKKEPTGGLQYGNDTFKIAYQWNECYVIDQVKFENKTISIKPFLPGGLDMLHPIFADLVMPPNQVESLSTLSDNWKMYSENNTDYVSTKITVSNDAWQHFRQGLGL